MSTCPYCGAEVRENAIKCRHCREWLRPIPPPAEAPGGDGGVNVPDMPARAVGEAAALDSTLTPPPQPGPLAPSRPPAASTGRSAYGDLSSMFPSSAPPYRTADRRLSTQLALAALGIVTFLLLYFALLRPMEGSFEDTITNALEESGQEAPPVAAEPLDGPIQLPPP